MSLDLASLLKNEIAKKQEELQNPAAEKPNRESPPGQREEHVEIKEQEDHAEESEVRESIEEQIERLRNRPQRIEKIVGGDAKIVRKIDPKDIGDPAQLKRVSMQCNLFIHDILSQWDKHSDEYHSELLVETKKALFPLLVKLRRATLSNDLVISLASVLYHLQQCNQNNLAIESYMKLSIGNVAWPIGVTSVGIHARSAHSKIQGSDGQVANVMLDEGTRLWITSIKRLITFHEWLNRT
ncbi:hypothetical protein HG537_0D04740 [Torulaspora globosa]|uniref:Pre-mRNA-splicing factor 18 n=1 Tax=Torulaspora globosa TaxID=48254 RepID=A0A7H9HRU6_9SACH|nr:hypothetical protein HG537_0D04740 [Torulaspora sp. CBS 2947]